MAAVRLCSAEGCDKKHHARGWCEMHWCRWKRRGQIEKHQASPGDTRTYLSEVVFPFPRDDECLKWPFFRRNNGYGSITYGGKSLGVHRVICEQVNGAPPTAKHVVAHSCGKGHEGCVNPHHLRWATPYENVADKALHGTLLKGEHHPNAKLTDEQIVAIRTAAGVSPRRLASRLALEFNVTKSYVRRLRANTARKV